jgi:uncharacterized membrane protein (DUF2068 family)
MRRGAMLVVIGLFKLAKGTLLVAFALALLRVGHDGLAAALAQWATHLHIDPDGHYFGGAVRAIAAVDARQLELVRAGLVVYGAVFLAEGAGLVLRQRWAEYVTVVVTGSFIPLELYEVARRPDGIRVAVWLVNVAIVWYLARGLRPGLPRRSRQARSRWAARRAGGRGTGGGFGGAPR